MSRYASFYCGHPFHEHPDSDSTLIQTLIPRVWVWGATEQCDLRSFEFLFYWRVFS